MAFYLKIKSGSYVRDVSDYVTDISEVPYISRNDDWTLVAEGYKFSLSSNCTQSLALNYPVFFYSESVMIHNGYISQKNYDYSNREYKIEVENALLNLKKYNVASPGFSTYIDARDATRNINGKDGKLILSTNIMAAIFEYAGMSLNFGDYYTAEAYGNVQTIHSDENQYTTQLTASVDEFWFLPNQIYSINQDSALMPADIEASETYKSKRISLFDLMSALMALRGFQLIADTSSSFQVINDRTVYSVSESKIYSKEENYVAKNEGLKLTYSTQRLSPQAYGGTNSWVNWFGYLNPGDFTAVYVTTNLSDPDYFIEYVDTVGTNFKEIPYYNNFTPIYTEWHEADATYYPLIMKANLANESLTKYYIEGLYSDKVEYKIETDLSILSTPKCAKRIAINVKELKTILEYNVVL